MNEENANASNEADRPLIAAAIANVRAAHGEAYDAAALASRISGFEPGNESALNKHVGGYLMEFSNVIRSISIESRTGLTSSAMQELAAHLEAAASCLLEDIAVVKIYDRVPFLGSLCNIEMLGNSICYLTGMDKTEADARMIEASLNQAIDKEAVSADLSDLV